MSEEMIPSLGLMIFHPRYSARALQEYFRSHSIMGRIIDDHFVLDFLTVFDKDIQTIVEKVNLLP